MKKKIVSFVVLFFLMTTSKAETTDYMLSSLPDSDLIILHDQVVQSLVFYLSERL